MYEVALRNRKKADYSLAQPIEFELMSWATGHQMVEIWFCELPEPEDGLSLPTPLGYVRLQIENDGATENLTVLSQGGPEDHPAFKDDISRFPKTGDLSVQVSLKVPTKGRVGKPDPKAAAKVVSLNLPIRRYAAFKSPIEPGKHWEVGVRYYAGRPAESLGELLRGRHPERGLARVRKPELELAVAKRLARKYQVAVRRELKHFKTYRELYTARLSVISTAEILGGKVKKGQAAPYANLMEERFDGAKLLLERNLIKEQVESRITGLERKAKRLIKALRSKEFVKAADSLARDLYSPKFEELLEGVTRSLAGTKAGRSYLRTAALPALGLGKNAKGKGEALWQLLYFRQTERFKHGKEFKDPNGALEKLLKEVLIAYSRQAYQGLLKRPRQLLSFLMTVFGIQKELDPRKVLRAFAFEDKLIAEIKAPGTPEGVIKITRRGVRDVTNIKDTRAKMKGLDSGAAGWKSAKLGVSIALLDAINVYIAFEAIADDGGNFAEWVGATSSVSALLSGLLKGLGVAKVSGWLGGASFVLAGIIAIFSGVLEIAKGNLVKGSLLVVQGAAMIYVGIKTIQVAGTIATTGVGGIVAVVAILITALLLFVISIWPDPVKDHILKIPLLAEQYKENPKNTYNFTVYQPVPKEDRRQHYPPTKGERAALASDLAKESREWLTKLERELERAAA